MPPSHEFLDAFPPITSNPEKPLTTFEAAVNVSDKVKLLCGVLKLLVIVIVADVPSNETSKSDSNFALTLTLVLGANGGKEGAPAILI